MARIKLPCVFLEKDEDDHVYRVLFMDPDYTFTTVEEFPYPPGGEAETKYADNHAACRFADRLGRTAKMQVIGLRTR